MKTPYSRTLLWPWVAVGLALSALLLAPSPLCAAAPVVTFTEITGNLVSSEAPGSGVQEAKLDLYFRLESCTPNQLANLLAYLSTPGVYAFQAQGGEPFLLDTVSVLHPGTGIGQINRWRVRLLGKGPTRGDGCILLALPAPGSPAGEWSFQGGTVQGTCLQLPYTYGVDWQLPRFALTIVPLGFGEGGFSFSASGEGVVGRSQTSLSTLSVDVQTSIGIPRDVADTPGANAVASEDNPGRFLLSYNRTGYRNGGKWTYGVRLRAAGPLDSLRDAEGVIYGQPLMGWFSEMHGFYGLEWELGVRDGDAEWTDLTTPAPPVGNEVARVGAVVEWAPILGGVNRDLSKGLRFFVRGRGWADMYDNEEGDRTVRWRGFLDAELFRDFGDRDQWRVFLRAQEGYLPPDLSLRTHRVSVGVGEGF